MPMKHRHLRKDVGHLTVVVLSATEPLSGAMR
jgi:hypothetical protein